jgi:predicted transcriptional regulator
MSHTRGDGPSHADSHRGHRTTTEGTRPRGRPNIIGVQKGLGPLEAQIIRTLAEIGRPATVREACTALARQDYFAYQGVLNCMNRLARKGLLGRSQEKRTYSYRLLVDPEAIAAQIVAETLAHLPGDLDRVVCRVLGIDPEPGAPEIARIRRKLGLTGRAGLQ